MREIKFRAWDDELKVMVTPHRSLDMCEYPNLMQYTGLRDKNDVEIYEGDILKFVNKSFLCGEIGVVKFNHGSFRIENEDFNSLFPKDRSIKKYIEVIGNIYENKELLDD